MSGVESVPIQRTRIVSWFVRAAVGAVIATTACTSTTPTTAPAVATPTAPLSASAATPPQPYRDADYGWLVVIPQGWIGPLSVSTRQQKYFVTNDPKIDPNQLGFGLQPGDGIFSVLIDATPATPASACITPQQNPGQTTEAAAIDRLPTTIYHWIPQNGHDSYYLYAVGNGHCYRLTFDFMDVAVANEQQTIATIVASFRFGP